MGGEASARSARVLVPFPAFDHRPPTTVSHVLALDQGTTSSRALVFDADGTVVARAQQEFAQHFPRPGWVEHDAAEIWQTQRATAEAALRQAGLSPVEIAAVGITNQRETTVLWDRSTGVPVARAVVWQDRRTADACARLDAELGDHLRRTTGLRADPYFSGTKLAWVLDHVEGARERAERGELAFGTVDTWLVWNLTEGRVHATDVTNASRTLLFDIHRLAWDDTLLDALGIPRSVLPTVVPSSGRVGETSLFGGSVPISGLAGDQHAALFGQACWAPGMAKNTYGTGCFMLMNTGRTPVVSEHGLDQGVRRHVHPRRGLVQHEDACLSKQGTGEAHELPLPRRQRRPHLRHGLVKAQS